MGLSSEILVGLALATFVPGFLPEINGARLNGLVEPHIINGVKVPIEKAPYQVSLEYFRVHGCGGAIVSEKHVLTAGHCIHGKSLWTKRLRVGSTLQIPFFNFFGGVTHGIQSIHVHPNMNREKLDYDLAVITTSSNFIFSPRVQSISVPTEGEDFLDYSQNLTLSGWGATEVGGWWASFNLQSVQVPLIKREACKSQASKYIQVTDRMLCGAGTGKGDSNSGDSGGPAVHKNNLVGIVSWGLRRHNPTLPSGFANLLNKELRSFIKTIAGV